MEVRTSQLFVRNKLVPVKHTIVIFAMISWDKTNIMSRFFNLQDRLIIVFYKCVINSV